MSKELTQWLADFDEGKVMESVDMSGFGGGYECAIQECAIKAMRTLQHVAIPETDEDFSAEVTTAVDEAADEFEGANGLTGAQVGAARNIAAVFWRQTPEKGIQMMKERNPARIIQISKGANDSVELK